MQERDIFGSTESERMIIRKDVQYSVAYNNGEPSEDHIASEDASQNTTL